MIPDSTVSGIHCKIYAYVSFLNSARHFMRATRAAYNLVMAALWSHCKTYHRTVSTLTGQGYARPRYYSWTAIPYRSRPEVRHLDIHYLYARLTYMDAEFECMHALTAPPQRVHFFDPTPRDDEVMKTKVRGTPPSSPSWTYHHCQHIGHYLLTSHCLGSGSFATVHLGMDSGSSSYKQVACKIIKRKKGQKMDKLMKEVRILTALYHVRSFLFSFCHADTSR